LEQGETYSDNLAIVLHLSIPLPQLDQCPIHCGNCRIHIKRIRLKKRGEEVRVGAERERDRVARGEQAGVAGGGVRGVAWDAICRFRVLGRFSIGALVRRMRKGWMGLSETFGR